MPFARCIAAGVAPLKDFLCCADFKAPQSLRDSSPQGSGFRKSTYSRCAWTAGQQQQMQLPGTAPPGEMQLQRQMQFTVTAPPVKMRLERSAERDKRE